MQRAAGWVATLVAAAAVTACWLKPLPASPQASAERELRPEAKEAARALIGSLDGWTQARSVHTGDQWMRMFTRLRPGQMGLRFEGECAGGAAQMLSIVRELDLLRTWNRYNDYAQLLRLASPYNLWAAAGTKLPWPIPKQSLLVHAQLANDPDSPRGVVASAYSPSEHELPQGVEMPRELRSRLEMLVDYSVVRLRPLPASEQAARTAFESVVLLDLSAIAIPVGSLSWLVNLVVYLIAPTIWNTFVEALDAVVAGGPANPHAARLKADSSGIYARVSQRTQQKR